MISEVIIKIGFKDTYSINEDLRTSLIALEPKGRKDSFNSSFVRFISPFAFNTACLRGSWHPEQVIKKSRKRTGKGKSTIAFKANIQLRCRHVLHRLKAVYPHTRRVGGRSKWGLPFQNLAFVILNNRNGLAILEGPKVFIKDGRLVIFYS